MAGGLPAFNRTVLGDLVEDRRLFLATRLPVLGWRWRVGHPSARTPAGMPAPVRPSEGKAAAIMDLQADKQVVLSGSYTDEEGNPVDAPAGAIVAYSNDNPAVLTLTDNGDGTAVAAATGTLGIADVHADADLGNGHTASGDLQIVVVAGDAERFAIAAGDPTEVTPDV